VNTALSNRHKPITIDMPCNVVGERIERCIDPRFVSQQAGFATSETGEKMRAKSIARKESMNIGAEHSPIRGARTIGLTVDDYKRPFRICPTGHS
jgi:hypothetical protein